MRRDRSNATDRVATPLSAYYLMGRAAYDLTGRALGESSPV